MGIDARRAGSVVDAVVARARLAATRWSEYVGVVALVLVLVTGAWLRLDGANWDRGTHLHPDERYIASVANVIHWPGSPPAYFEVRSSTLSPYNTDEGRAYSYGTLPLFGTKAVADVLGKGDYDHLYLVGRRLSALLDCATILLVFLIARTIVATRAPRRAFTAALLAAALYSVTVAAVQASHFFTTDVWLVFFGTLAFYLALRLVLVDDRSDLRTIGLSALVGACVGLAIASKASGLFVLLPVVVALAGGAVARAATDWPRATVQLARNGLFVLVAAYLAFRLASPYSFASSNWLDVSLGSDYRKALATQQDILDGKAIFPPTLQWLLSPRVWDPFRNLVTWQLGLPLGVAACIGVLVLARELTTPIMVVARGRRRPSWPAAGRAVALTQCAMLLVYVGGVFLYVGTRFQHMGRYLLPIVPLLAVAAAYALVVVESRRDWLLRGLGVILVVTTGVYALAFRTVYTTTTTRLAANDWIASHVRGGSTIASENWDDSLPVGGAAQGYQLVIVPVFDPDDETKLRKLFDGLDTSDYYSLSSPRAWRTIGRLPDRYPLMVRFYRQLFAGRLGFEQVASMSSPPRLLGVRLDDLGAEEAFWVYDHPRVRIFRHQTRLTFAEFREALCEPRATSGCA